MEQRKIQITGGNSFIVSLPRDWVTKSDINKGDYVSVDTNEDGTLTIFPKKQKKQKRTFTIKLTDSVTLNSRLLISKYLEGYDIIEMVSEDRIPKEVRKGITKTVKNLIGIEIFEETSNKFVVSSLVGFGSIKIEKILRRIIIITSSIFSESLEAMMENSFEFAREIMPREDEVDKFYFHGIRELAEASRKPQLLKDMGIKRSTDILSYLTILKSVERIADYLNGIIILYTTYEDEMPKEVIDFGTECLGIYNDVTANIFLKDVLKANSFLDSLKSKEEGVPKITQISEKGKSLEVVSSHSRIIDYYVRIIRHCGNLSELIINLSV